MVKRRLPVIHSASGAEAASATEHGSFVGWACVAFSCAVLIWLPLAALVNAATNAGLDAALPGWFSPPNTTRVALAALFVAHLAAYAASVAASAFVVGRFGTAAPERSVLVGVGVLVGLVLSFAGAGAWRVGLAAAVFLAPVGIGAVRVGFRKGRRR